MKTNVKAVAVVTLVGLCAYSWGHAQGDAEVNSWDNQVTDATAKGGGANAAKLSQLYSQIPRNPRLVERVAENAFIFRSNGQPDTIPLLVTQTYQNQKLIEQNEAMMKQNVRIIALLEAQAKQRSK